MTFACVYGALFCNFLNCSHGNEPSESHLRSDKSFVFSSLTIFWSILDLQSCVSFRCVAKWFCYTCTCIWASMVAQMVKNLPAIQETGVWSLGQQEPLEEEMATHYSILAWRIPWTEETGGLHSMGSHRVRHDWATNTFTSYIYLFSFRFFSQIDNCRVLNRVPCAIQ